MTVDGHGQLYFLASTAWNLRLGFRLRRLRPRLEDSFEDEEEDDGEDGDDEEPGDVAHVLHATGAVG